MSGLTVAAMRELEEAAFARGVDPGGLMDAAGRAMAARLLDLVGPVAGPGTAVAYVGKGNNGGDALVVLEVLRAAGWRIALRATAPPQQWGVLSRQRQRRLGVEPVERIDRIDPPDAAGPLVLLDGLLGIGGRGDLRGPVAGLAGEMARLRGDHGAQVVAVDLPSGVDGDTGAVGAGAVVADWTLTVGAPKWGLMEDAAVNHIGRLVLVPVEDLPLPSGGEPRLICPEGFPGLLAPRRHDVHKGDAGELAVLAGSPGMTGAAALAVTGALRAGAGKVTLHVDEATFAAFACRLPAEVMVRVSRDPLAACFAQEVSARVIGPGLGEAPEGLFDALSATDRPVVLDADALNAIAARGRHDCLGPRMLVTPHPGEFRRLAPDLAGRPRREQLRGFVDRHGCCGLLKGARSLVATPGGPLAWNPTGNAGMAGGGQGDVLAGVAGALLAAGKPPFEAGLLAAWLCGRAAERAVSHGGESEESLLAGAIPGQLGGAFDDWRRRRR